MDPATRQPRQASSAGYFERLRTPWWWYLASVGVSALLGLEFAVAVSGWIAWLPFAIVLPGGLLIVWRLSSGSVSVDGATVRAGERRVPVTEIEQAIDLTPTELRRLVGRHGDPLAFTYIRSWVGPGAQLVLRPPAEPRLAGPRLAGHGASELAEPEQDGSQPSEYLPVPYWVVSSRHPDRLLAAIQAARATGPQLR